MENPIFSIIPPLTSQQVIQSRELYGQNILPKKKTITFFTRYIQAFNDPLIKILCFASLITFTLALFGHTSIFDVLGIVFSVFVSTYIATWSDHTNEEKYLHLQQQQLDSSTSLIYRHFNATAQFCDALNHHSRSIPFDEDIPCTCINPFSCTLHHQSTTNSSSIPLPSTHPSELLSPTPFSPAPNIVDPLSSISILPNSSSITLVSLNSRDLVVGDLVLLQQGDEVPADGWLIHGNCAVNQSSMTGEDISVVKTSFKLTSTKAAHQSACLASQSPQLLPSSTHLVDLVTSSRFSEFPLQLDFEHPSSVFKSTIVEEGQGIMFVWKVGKETLCGITLASFNQEDDADDDDEGEENEEENQHGYHFNNDLNLYSDEDNLQDEDDEDANDAMLLEKHSFVDKSHSSSQRPNKQEQITPFQQKEQTRPKAVKKSQPTPPLVRKLQQFSETISYWAYYGAITIALIHLFQCVVIKNDSDLSKIYQYFSHPVLFFRDVTQSIILSVIMCVVAIPEGLPALCALVLALNMHRLLNQSVLVKKLIGISTSGHCTILFVDKTGTISTGVMHTETVLSFSPQRVSLPQQNHQSLFKQNEQTEVHSQSQPLLFPVLRSIPNQTQDLLNTFLLFCLQESCGNATYQPQPQPQPPPLASSSSDTFINLNINASDDTTIDSIEHSLDITSLIIDDDCDDGIVGGNSTDRAILRFITQFTSQHPLINSSYSSCANILAELPFSSARKFGLKFIEPNEHFTQTFFPSQNHSQNPSLSAHDISSPQQSFDPFNHILPSSSETTATTMPISISNNKNRFYLIKGAVEVVLEQCTHYYTSSSSIPSQNGQQSIIKSEITTQQLEAMQHYIKQMSSQGARIIAIAIATPLSSFSGTFSSSSTLPSDITTLESCTLCVVLVIRDQLRSSTPSALLLAKEAGIRAVIVSGDKIETCTHFASISGSTQNSTSFSHSSSSTLGTCNMEEFIPKPPSSLHLFHSPVCTTNKVGNSNPTPTPLLCSYFHNTITNSHIPFSHRFLPLLIHAISHNYSTIALNSYHISLLSLVDIYLLLPKLIVVARALPQDKLKLVLAAQMGYNLLHQRFQIASSTSTSTSTSASNIKNNNIALNDNNTITASSHRFALNGNSSYTFHVNAAGIVVVHFRHGKPIPYHKLNSSSLATLFTRPQYDISSQFPSLPQLASSSSSTSTSTRSSPLPVHIIPLSHDATPLPVNIHSLSSHVTGQLGDGENDCLALNACDVSFVVGSGQQSAKAAATILLLRNSLLCVISAIWYGRSLFNNIRNFVLFQISINLGICLLLVVAPFLSSEFPLTLGQLLFLNIVIDSVAATVLAAEPPKLSLLGQRPLHPSTAIVSTRIGIAVIANGIFISILSLTFLTSSWIRQIFTPGYGAMIASEINPNITPYDIFLTGFFAFMILVCCFHTINARTQQINVFHQISRNLVCLVCVPILLLSLYLFTIVPFFRGFLYTVPLTIGQWVCVFLASSMVLLFEAIRKMFTIWYFRNHPEVLHNQHVTQSKSKHSNHLTFSSQSTSAFDSSSSDEELGAIQTISSSHHTSYTANQSSSNSFYPPQLNNPRLKQLLEQIHESDHFVQNNILSTGLCATLVSIGSLSEQYQGEIISA